MTTEANHLQKISQDSKTLILKVERFLLSCQQKDGAVLWYKDGKLDPWDHTEALMGLSIAGNFEAVKAGFRWLKANQNSDGSWYAAYFGKTEEEKLAEQKIETNFVAYPACGLWHYWLISQDSEFVNEIFPTIERGIEFALSHQKPDGDIQWAISKAETLPNDALVTACSSILRSLECAIALAEILNIEHKWEQPYQRLADTLKNKPWRFDRTWAPKTRFSMDWFYPILAGIYSPEEARLRLTQRWQDFVEPRYGCRCVEDEPWVTIAESCELTLALIASEQKYRATKFFNLLRRWQDVDGGFWTGYSFRDEVVWPLEKTSWTAAAVLLALDALENISPASRLFTSPSGLLSL